jgi:hypothetical protein
MGIAIYCLTHLVLSFLISIALIRFSKTGWLKKRRVSENVAFFFISLFFFLLIFIVELLLNKYPLAGAIFYGLWMSFLASLVTILIVSILSTRNSNTQPK